LPLITDIVEVWGDTVMQVISLVLIRVRSPVREISRM
jgi:hypothetical protein